MKDLTKTRLTVLLLFILVAVMMPTRHMEIDFEFWTDWALKIHRLGLTNVYTDYTVNYHPMWMYALYLHDMMQGSETLIKANINNLKFFGLIFDFLPVVVLCCFRKKLIKEEIPYLFLLLNVAYLFNSVIWGQLDSVHTNLSFLALLFGFTNPVLSAFLFACALGTKLQTIVYIPLLCIVWLYSVRNFKTVALMLLVIVGTEFLIVLPFIAAGKGMAVWNVVTGAIGRYPWVSICAFNIWYLIMTGNPNHTLDSDVYFVLTYKQFGLLLFLLFSAATLLPFLFRLIRQRLANETIGSDTQKMLMLVAGLISFYFYYFNTQMHERYSSPIVIFFFFYAVFSKNYKLYILASICYFLTLDKCFPDYLPIVHYKIIYASKVITIWYTITLVYALYLFFKEYNIKKEYQLLKQQWKLR
jgi:Gpi18-like mannosyltransferase